MYMTHNASNLDMLASLAIVLACPALRAKKCSGPCPVHATRRARCDLTSLPIVIVIIVIMPAAAPVEPGSSSSAIISAISVALPMGSSDSGPSRAVVAALGSEYQGVQTRPNHALLTCLRNDRSTAEPVQPNDALFPTYGRPLYPFTLLDRQKARLLPLPSDRRFPTELEAKHAIQEHALNQGYKLEATIDGKHGKVWRCRTGSKCRYAAKIRKDDQGAWAVESGIDGNHQHTHGASFRIGTLYWSRGLTREEIAALRKCSDAGRLKSIFDLMAFVVYSRKRLSSVIPLPGVPFFASFWERFCSSRWPEGTEVLPTPNPSQASPVAPVAPLTDPAPSKVIELLEREWPRRAHVRRSSCSLLTSLP